MKCFWWLLILLLSCICDAEIKESDDYFVRTREHNLIARMVKSGFCSDVLADKEVIVTWRAGAGYQQIMILGRPNSDAKYLARMLDEWAYSSLPKRPDVVWSQEDDYAAAALDLKSSGFLADSASSDTPFGSLVAFLKLHDLKASCGLVVPKYCKAPTLSFPKGADKRLTNLYNVSNATEKDQIHISCELSFWHKAAFWLFVLGVPSVLLISFAYAFRLAKNEAIPLDERRLRYSRAVSRPTIVAICVHAPFALFFLFSGMAYPLVDVWFGSSSAISIAPFIMMMPFFAFVAWIPIRFAEEKLFSKDGKGPLKPAKTEPDPTELPKWQTIALTLGALAGGFTLVFGSNVWVPKEQYYLRPFLFLAGMLMPSFGVRWLITFLTKRRAKSLPEPNADPVAEKAFEIARMLKAKLWSVKVVEGDPETQSLDLFFYEGRLSIPRRAVNELTDDELTFAMALSLSQRTGKMMVKVLLLIVPIALVGSFVMIWLPKWMPEGTFWTGPQYRILSMVLVPVLMAPFMFRLMGNEQYRAYLSALQICKSAEAARSYEPRRLRLFLTRNAMLPISRHNQKLYDRSLRMLEKAIKDEGLG